MPSKRLLRFGIPSLDRLFTPRTDNRWAGGVDLRTPRRDGHREPDHLPLDQHVSMCIMGPSGTGKSLLGLHLVSRYWADSLSWNREGIELDPAMEDFAPCIFYLSTDLGLRRAQATWQGFGLERPNTRQIPFGESEDPTHNGKTHWKVDLTRYDQENLEDLARYFIDHQSSMDDGSIAFLDLAEGTAGDDWGFITRLLSLLPQPVAEQPNHLLVIDAVEGLEMLTGDTDAFGQNRSRRSRIAQILRAAADKCHVVLILEEDSAHQHPAEEYVTDIVLRLRVKLEGRYFRRSLELVKARGQTHIRGEHDYVIRAGRDSVGDDGAGVVMFPDDPPKPVSYIQVIRSLHSLSRTLMYHDEAEVRSQAEDDPASELAFMVTPKLGNILPKRQFNDPTVTSDRRTYTLSGLYRGKVTSLIGDEATLKSRFGRAFLAGAFAPVIGLLTKSTEAAVLISTFNSSQSELLERIKYHWAVSNPRSHDKEMEKRIRPRLIYRQLEIHHLNSSQLFHIIRRSVEYALMQLAREDAHTLQDSQVLTTEASRNWQDHSERAGRVRIVIDDWALIESTHPEVAEDKLFLPFLIKYFQRVGVTALIIATQPGRPEEILSGTSEQVLRSLSDYHIYTWHVPFYGSDRVAITAMPPMSAELAPSVGELRLPTLEEIERIGGEDHEWEHTERSERLWVDQHFDLYRGLERKVPEPVSLEVRLFSGAAGFEEYAGRLNGLLNRLFTATAAGNILIPEDRAQYAELREFSTLHGDVRCDHTFVIQVDEYWKEVGPRDERAVNYLNQKTYDGIEQKMSSDLTFWR